MYCGYVCKVNGVRKHPNADRLLLVDLFSTTTCVGADFNPDELQVYFPSDGRLSEEFCIANHLLRKLPDGTPDKGYLESNRHIRAIKLRGERSDGILLSISCLEPFGDISSLAPGDQITTFNGHMICEKYIPIYSSSRKHGKKNRTPKIDLAPQFAEHVETEQLAYNLDAFKPGDLVEITIKMHGTSQRTGYLPVRTGFKRTALDMLLRRPGKPIYEYRYITGTRRIILEDFDKGGYYGDNAFREPAAKAFDGKLHQGETVYYEVVGFTTTGKPIMPSVKNSKINDKEFKKLYGDTTVFSYGCEPNTCDFYVYRMTLTTTEGFVVDYSPDFMRYRCEEMGVKFVPVAWQGYIDKDEENPGEWIKNVAEQYYDGPDPIGKTHVREGVVVRIVNCPSFYAYKHKNYFFKILSGIAVESVAEDEVDQDRLEEM